MVSGVYAIKNLIDGKMYVGSAVKLVKRICAHKNMLKSGTHHSIHLQRAWNKYGSISFRFVILVKCAPEDCIQNEQLWIDNFRSANPRYGYNRRHRAESNFGLTFGKVTRAKQSAFQQRRPKSKEHRAAIAAALRGKKKSPEAVAKCVAVLRGRKLSAAHRKAISIGVAKAQSSPEYRRMMAVKIRGKKRTPEQIEKVVTFHRGKKRSPETCRKLSEAAKKRFLTYVHPMLGKHHTM